MPKKFIMGWLHFKPGKRDDFIAKSRWYADACRAEAGCEFFDFSLCPFDPDLAMVMECFSDRRAHEEDHIASEHFKRFWKALGEVCVEGRFQNILSDTVKPERHVFSQAN